MSHTTDTNLGTIPSVLPSDSRRKKPGLISLIVGFALVAVCLVGEFTSPSGAVAGMWCIAMMIVLMFLSVPVAIALADRA